MLINSGFLDWVQNQLISNIRSEFPNEVQYQPNHLVPAADYWLSPLISNTVATVSDYPDFNAEDPLSFYIALEQDFDCNEKDCVQHTSWRFHIKRLRDDAETIGESIELSCLTFHVEAWLESFLELRFPSITFDYDSLMHEDSLPQLQPY